MTKQEVISYTEEKANNQKTIHIVYYFIVIIMAKKDIHPTYYNNVEVHCICGKVHVISAAVQGPIKIETCSACHPIYTGVKETKVVKGRMEKFNEKIKKIESLQAKTAA